MIRATLFSMITGLVGAIVLHILIILALPSFTGLDAYTRLTSYDVENRFIQFGPKSDPFGFSTGDPFLSTAACLFSIEDQPLQITASGDVPFWSVAIYDSASNEVFSMNDRSAAGGDLDAIIASPAQLAAIRRTDPDVISDSVLIEMPRPDGYVVLRALSPVPSMDGEAKAFVNDADCLPYSGR
ncbi:DUF1254 domain-containing protein [Rhizobium alvei]|uniref:DUF1254 domain-containing protein n=1 Tax=Rhizobium alvei TaxID=1132659 RepID=A0ABT8YIA4_9HYPH|nr:DUF1254 domain-containing protein [Rhizobium alvei]MDO6963009.1 DUF1254 domain-containing protein [Rhizobium alvei]